MRNHDIFFDLEVETMNTLDQIVQHEAGTFAAAAASYTDVCLRA
jgi:hypothetical protein